MKNQKQKLITSRQLTSNCFQSQNYNGGMQECLTPALIYAHYTAPFSLLLSLLSRD